MIAGAEIEDISEQTEGSQQDKRFNLIISHVRAFQKSCDELIPSIQICNLE